MFKWFRNWRVRRAKKRVIRALSSVWMFDDLLIDSGYSRQERRQFWRDIIKHPSVALSLAKTLEER